jgi:hypothetical protein
MYLISMYYKRYELQWRFSLFFAASIMAGGFGGVRPLAKPRNTTDHFSFWPLPSPRWMVSVVTEDGDGFSY